MMELFEYPVETKEVIKFGLGDIVEFPSYGTAYVVHRPDTASVEKYMPFKPRLGDYNSYQLYRLDGKKSYRKEPFFGYELANLIRNLDGKVYSKTEYTIQLMKK